MAGVTRALGLAFLIASAGCSAPQAVAERDRPSHAGVLRISADPFIASLAEEFAHVAPRLQIRTPALNESAWTAIQRNELDLAIAPANNAYFAYVEAAQRGVAPDAQLRVISALHVTPFILVVRPDSGIRRVTDLRGRTIARYLSRSPAGAPRPSATAGTASQGTPDTMRVTELLLDAFGVDDVRMVGRLTADQIISAFKRGTVDAAFGTAFFQRDAFNTLTAAGARFVPIEGAQIDELRRKFPFIRPAIVAAGTFPGQTTPLRTIGVDLLLVCRSGLDAELVYSLTRQYFATLPALLAKTDSVGRIDLERASASPIPLHDGAARYYRESELYR